MSDPSLMGQLIIDLELEKEQHTVDALFKDMRLLPSRAKFRKQIEHWAAAAISDTIAQ